MSTIRRWITRRIQDVGPWLNRYLPEVRGKGRVMAIWRGLCGGPIRRFETSAGMSMDLNLSIPYEASIWLSAEEAYEMEHLGAILKGGEVFVDVGANIGLWTLAAAAAVGPEGRVLAFEPTPATAARLSEHVRLNGLAANVELHNIALGDVRGFAPIATSLDHNRNLISGALESVERAGSVPVDTLDCALGGRTVHGIKIDVEGYELQVLQGATDVVERCRPWICVEFNVEFTGAPDLAAWCVHQWLVRRGYVRGPFLLSRESMPRVSPSWSPVGYENLIYWHQDGPGLVEREGV